MAEFAAHARPAAIVLDLQHGLWERGTVEAAIASTGQRVPVIARCADNTTPPSRKRWTPARPRCWCR